jgi:hypothetical protein
MHSSGYERLTVPIYKPQADDGAGQRQEPFVDVRSALVADAQPPESMQPAQRSLDHPAPAAQMFTAFNAPSGNARLYASGAQPLAVGSVVVALVGVQFGRSSSRSPLQTGDGWQVLNQWTQQLGVMDIGRRELDCQGQPPLIDDDVMFATELAPVGGIEAGVIPAEVGGKERWPSRCWRVPIRSGRTALTCAAPIRAGAATRRPSANRASAASRSCHSRNPTPWAGTPKECRFEAQRGCRSGRPGRSREDGHRWAKAHGRAAEVQSLPTTHRSGLAWPW